jgi:hypothetical protein
MGGYPQVAPADSAEDDIITASLRQACAPVTMPTEWKSRMRSLATDAASRTRGDGATGLGWQPPRLSRTNDGIFRDPMALWEEDEIRAVAFRERAARAHRRAMVGSAGFASVALFVAFAAADLPPGLANQAWIADSQQSVRTAVASLTRIYATHGLPTEQPSMAVASAEPLEAPLTDLNGPAMEVVVVLRAEYPAVVRPPVPNGNGSVRRLVTSARAAENLTASLAPWQQVEQDIAGMPPHDHYANPSPMMMLVSGMPARHAGPAARSYRAPAPIAVEALRQAMREDYPESETVESELEQGGHSVAEVLIRPMSPER